eukprot:TRINITY_DN5890_c0_g1_i1.p1 TRINITY_DN5890_c0_g1~~TRINITY_DN5890_c0_g1_i1.p1  ORF type:complete len:879 (-),score=155.57 TRINITY_DN5890_c0_g1_i1:118-2754(-)
MQGVALGSGIGPEEWKTEDNLMLSSIEKNEAVKINVCKEETSRDVAQILQARQIANNPMRAYTRMCSESLTSSPDGAPPLRKAKKANSYASQLASVLSVLQWLPMLDFHTIKADIVAGLTVGVMVIPQSMSYGSIAGLPYINGMYSACVPTFVYAFFGQSRQLAVGPVAMVSLLVEAGLNGQLGPECDVDGKAQYETCTEQYVALACLTAMVVGAMQILASILRLGFLVSFLGHPVISGFTSGAAIIIGLSQIKYMLGFDIPKSQYIYDTAINVASNIGQTKFMPLLLGVVWLGFLVANKKIAAKYPRLRILGAMGPLISCLVGTLVVYFIPMLRDELDVKYVGEVPSGIFPVSISSWQLDKIPTVIATAVPACLIGYMESIAIGKNLASKHGYDIDAGQEMFALGIANIVGAAFSCYPVTGSFSRSAVNNSTGALSQLSGVITALVMLATLLFLTPLFYYLPKFCLAAIVINSVIPLVALGEAKRLFFVKRQDFVLWVTAFLGTLFLGVLMGISLAVALSLGIVIYESVRPQITILWRIPGTTIYRSMKQESRGCFIPNVFICRIGSSLYFANASFVKEMLLTYVSDLEEVNKTEYMIIEMTPVVSVDSTACHVIKDIVNDFRGRGLQVAFAMVGNRVEKTLRKAGLKTFIGDQWFFHTVEEAVIYCIKHQHATKSWQGDTSCISPKDSIIQAEVIGLDAITVQPGNEIGFSNDLHASCTMVFINLTQDVPMIMSDLTAVFRRNSVTIVRAQIDSLDLEDASGAKDIFYIRSIKTGSKLSELEMQRVRDDLEAVLCKHKVGSGHAEGNIPTRTYSSYSADSLAGSLNQQDRMLRLEEALDQQLETTKAMQAELDQMGQGTCLPMPCLGRQARSQRLL